VEDRVNEKLQPSQEYIPSVECRITDLENNSASRSYTRANL
jgi:hypothetical protein